MTRDICSSYPADDATAKRSNVVSLAEYCASKYGAATSADREDVLKRLSYECEASIARLSAVDPRALVPTN